VNLRFNNSGEIEVYRGGTYLNRATGQSIGIDTWKYVEFRVKCHNTNGEYELRINEQVVLSDTALNTQAGANPYHNGFGFVALSSSAGPIFDDFYLLDSSGTVNNTFLGNMRVCTLRPDSDGDSSAWTPNSGANYAMVDEVQSDDDSTYVEGATSGDKDLYHYESLPQVTDAIKAVQIVTECRETDAQTFNIQMPVKSGALEDDGSGQVVGSSDYVQRFRLMDVNPITGLPWTIAEVNAAQFGIKLP
jgi:hypothetical protein